jgi:Domain of unknown function (DUF4190)/Septum formation
MDPRFNPTPNWPPVPETLIRQPDRLSAAETLVPQPSWLSAPQAVVPQPGRPSAPQAVVPQPGRPSAPQAVVPQPGWTPNPSWSPPPARAKTSGLAIASFVCGLLGFVLFSLIFGVVALRRIKRSGQRGEGLAITGLALSGAWIVLIVIIVVFGYLGSATRSSTTGQITHRGNLSVLSLAVGDCFNNPVGATSVVSVTAIPCNQAHNAQIYAEFKLAGSDQSYPGTAVLTRLATSGCNARTGSIDRSEVTNSMTLRFLFPEADSWLNGNRAVACMITNPTANLTSSLLNP